MLVGQTLSRFVVDIVFFFLVPKYFSKEGSAMSKMLGMNFDDEESAWKVMQGVEASGRIASAQVNNF